MGAKEPPTKMPSPKEIIDAVNAKIRKDLGVEGEAVQVTAQNDDTTTKPAAETVDVKTVAGPGGDSAVAMNLTDLAARVTKCAQELDALVKDAKGDLADEARTHIAKAGPASVKLAQIAGSLGVDLAEYQNEDEWKLRCKIGDMVSVLQQAATLERLLGTPLEKAAAKKPVAWPRDMAAKDPTQSWARD